MLRSQSLAAVGVALLAAGPMTPARGAAAPGQPSQEPQSQEQAAPDTTQEPTAPRAIRASDIPTSAEQTNARLRQIRERIDEPDLSVAGIAKLVPDFTSQLQMLADDPASRDPQGQSGRRLESLRQQWQQIRAALEGAQAGLAERSQSLKAARDTLDQIRAIWKATAEAAPEQALPRAAMDQVDSVLAAIEELQGQLQARLDFVLTLQTRIAQQLIDVNDQLARLEAARKEARLQRFTPEAPPIWRASSGTGPDGSLVTLIRASWNEETANLGRYARDNPQRLLLHLAILVAMLVATIGLRRRGPKGSQEDEVLAAFTHITARPVSAAILLTVLVTRLVHPLAPPVLYDLSRVVALVPILRLLPALLHPRLRVPLYGLAGLFLLDEFREPALGGTVVERYLLLVVTALALAGLVRLLRPDGPVSAVSGERRWRAAARLAGLGLIALSVSLIANVLGYASLAHVLTRGTLVSAYIAAVLFAGASVLDGLALLLLRSRAARTLNSVRRHSNLLTRRTIGLIHFSAFVVWAEATLWHFDVWAPLVQTVKAALGYTLTIGALSVSIGGVLAFAVAVCITVLLSRFIRFVLAEDILPRLALPRGVGDSISKVVHYTILGVGLMVALAAAGIELQSFALIAGALGIGIGFGLQNLVNNFVSGLILVFERPVKLGDTIEFGDRIGIVKRIGIRSSTVRTFDGAEVIVPNGNLISAEVVNWTLSDRLRRIEIPVGVAYGTDPQRVLDILLDAATNHPEILERPEPTALFVGFGDSSLDFVARLWTANFDEWRKVQSEVAVRINAMLKEAGIEIPFPQRDLHVRSIDPSVKREMVLDEGDEKF